MEQSSPPRSLFRHYCDRCDLSSDQSTPFPEQVAYIAAHAEDVGLLYDLEYQALAATVSEALGTLRVNVALCAEDELPADSPSDVVAYEQFIEAADEDASVYGVRRAKAALSSGCKPHPATAPAGSNRSSHGGNEVAEAFD